MKHKLEKIQAMINQVEEIIQDAQRAEKKYSDLLTQVHPAFTRSARNLIHYRSMRKKDIRDLQKKLGYLGLSRLAKAESHVMASLNSTHGVLHGFVENKKIKTRRSELSIKTGGRMLRKNAKALLGYRSKGRRTRIMVTLPTTAAESYELVHDLVAAGMNCARINCAHDGPEVWDKMVAHVRKASKKLKRNCKVTMDLGGPKIRTGALLPGPEVVKLSPIHDARGKIIGPVRLWIGPEPHEAIEVKHIPLNVEEMEGLNVGDRLYFTDTRGKKRYLKIAGVEESGRWADAYDTAFLETGMKLFKDTEMQTEPLTVGVIPPIEQRIILHQGDTLIIHKNPEPGVPAEYDEEGNVTAIAHVSCTAPEVFEYVKKGEPILFDDGKIEGKITKVTKQEIHVLVEYAKEGGGKLKSDKGINFPASALKISGLTAKDRKDLEFVVEHADVVNMSFVNHAQDVEDLLGELKRLNASDDLGVILKIETQSGFNQLTEILLTAMQRHPVGVMIARGDLAIEVGWDNIARIQEEILSLCQAAHIPDIWATQVLENLAKKGIPSRAEITDAAMSQRAECVMLNKGPHIVRAINLLDTILKDLSDYQEKKAPLSPAMEEAVSR